MLLKSQKLNLLTTMCESSMAVPLTNDVTKKEEEKFDTSYTTVLDISSDSFSNIANSDVFNVSLTEQLEEVFFLNRMFFCFFLNTYKICIIL